MLHAERVVWIDDVSINKLCVWHFVLYLSEDHQIGKADAQKAENGKSQ